MSLPWTSIRTSWTNPPATWSMQGTAVSRWHVGTGSIGRSLQGQFHTHDLSSGLYTFLTVDPRISIVHWESQDVRFQGAGYALIDLETMSAAVLSDGHPDRVMVYGNDAACVELIGLLDRWDEQGHPSIHALRIRAFSVPPQSIREDNWVVPKRSAYNWVMSWDG